MAQRRYLSPDASKSRKVAALANGPGGHLAVALWALMLPFVDDGGRMEADPDDVRISVVPRWNVSDADVQSALERIASVGLISLYRVEGRQYLEYASFHKYQTYIPDSRRVSPLPGPDQDRIEEHPSAEERTPAQISAEERTPAQCAVPVPVPDPVPLERSSTGECGGCRGGEGNAEAAADVAGSAAGPALLAEDPADSGGAGADRQPATPEPSAPAPDTGRGQPEPVGVCASPGLSEAPPPPPAAGSVGPPLATAGPGVGADTQVQPQAGSAPPGGAGRSRRAAASRATAVDGRVRPHGGLPRTTGPPPLTPEERAEWLRREPAAGMWDITPEEIEAAEREWRQRQAAESRRRRGDARGEP
jgi:hypothetical protein